LEKAPDAFRTISEVADELDVPQHVLRFWESRFQQIKPMKRGGGRRYYRPDDVDLLRGVRHLLYGEGYTIRGVQRILKEEGAAFVQDVWRTGAEPPPPQLDEDVADGKSGEATTTRPEPNLFAVAPPRASVAAPAEERREPVVELPSPHEPAKGQSIEDRRKLQAALDELIACRTIIENALRQDV
jgi:DNA-binding transcriptional MerR regulator